jgi:hypothetical protein
MADIYAGSYLNIAAVASGDAHGGIINLSSAPDSESRLTRLRYKLRARDNLVETPPRGIAESAMICPDVSSKEESDYRRMLSGIYPYTGRGWVLQELALAPRTILFPKGQMFWQCRHGFESEDGTVSATNFSVLSRGGHDPYVARFNLQEPELAYDLWRLWIDSYTIRKLTFASDVAPAITGLLSYFQKKTGWTPILGIWKEMIGYGLSWRLSYRVEESLPPPSPVESQFPSWSWLSVLPIGDGGGRFAMQPIVSDLQLSEYFCFLHVESWKEDWAGPLYTSTLNSSKLVVSGFVRDGKVLVDPNGEEALGFVFPVTVLGEPNCEGAVTGLEYLFPAGSEVEVKILHLFQAGQSFRDGSYGFEDHFLVLRARSGSPNQFFRIGKGGISGHVHNSQKGEPYAAVNFGEVHRMSIELV